jgi:hypothetical protein
VFEAGIGGAGSKDLAELVKANFFANIELNQHQHRTAEGGIRRLGGNQRGQRFGGDLTYGWSGDGEFIIHDSGHAAPKGAPITRNLRHA